MTTRLALTCPHCYHSFIPPPWSRHYKPRPEKSEFRNLLMRMSGGKHTVQEIADAAGKPMETVYVTISVMRKQGYDLKFKRAQRTAALNRGGSSLTFVNPRERSTP